MFLLSGLWHGAELTFLIWGAILGLALSLEKFSETLWQHFRMVFPALRPCRIVSISGVFAWYLVVQLVWIASLVFFRSENVQEALSVYDSIFALNDVEVLNRKARLHYIPIGWGLVIPVILMQLRTFLSERFPAFEVRATERFVYAGVMLGLSVTLYASPRSFIYFQF